MSVLAVSAPGCHSSHSENTSTYAACQLGTVAACAHHQLEICAVQQRKQRTLYINGVQVCTLGQDLLHQMVQ